MKLKKRMMLVKENMEYDRTWGRPVLGDPLVKDNRRSRKKLSHIETANVTLSLLWSYAFLVKGERCGVAAPRINAPHYSSRTRKPRTYERAARFFILDHQLVPRKLDLSNEFNIFRNVLGCLLSFLQKNKFLPRFALLGKRLVRSIKLIFFESTLNNFENILIKKFRSALESPS